MELKFNSQVCTTIEQSKKLLELGLKPETADMYHATYYDANDNNNIVKYTCVRHKELPLLSQDFPAWSLHRLLQLLYPRPCICGIITDNPYDDIIDDISVSIEDGEFRGEYLNK